MKFDRLRQYYTAAAPTYGAVDHIFGGLAEALISFAIPTGHILDLGCGWGAVTKHLPMPCIGLDFIHTMCSIAAENSPHVPFVNGDMHTLPFANHSFDSVIAQFAFNSTDPSLSFAEVRRILKEGGRLSIHEWGDIDPLSEAVADTFSDYIHDDPPDDLVAFREHMKTPIPWDAIDGIEALANLIVDCDFEIIHCDVVEITVPVRPVDFVRYKLAWPARQMEMSYMADGLELLCEAELIELVESYAQPDGYVLWEPDIVQIQVK